MTPQPWHVVALAVLITILGLLCLRLEDRVVHLEDRVMVLETHQP